MSGNVEKHMLHNDAWHFWQMGRHLERALFTALTMRQMFLKRSDGRHGVAPGPALFDADDNLDALLRLLGNRQFEARAHDHLGDALHALGQVAEARESWRQAEELHQATDRPDLADAVRAKLA